MIAADEVPYKIEKPKDKIEESGAKIEEGRAKIEEGRAKTEESKDKTNEDLLTNDESRTCSERPADNVVLDNQQSPNAAF